MTTSRENPMFPMQPEEFWFRGEDPERPVQFNDQLKVWDVYGHPETLIVLSDTGTFSSDITRRVVQPGTSANEGNLLEMDPPDHTKLRRLVAHAFTPKFVANFAPSVARLTHELLDAVTGQDEIELIKALAYPLPITVVTELLGLPAEDLEQFREWTIDVLEAYAAFESGHGHQAQMVSSQEMFDYILDHARQRRARPHEDLLTVLAQAEVDGERLTDIEIANFVGLLLLAGYITTKHLLGNTVLCLDHYRDDQALVRADRALLPTAIEESLRFLPPFTSIYRHTTREKTIGDIVIPAGAGVTAWLGAANRDSRVFPEPHSFNIFRNPNPHIAFGRGAHFCIGAPLARLEGRIVLDILMDRYPEWTLDPANPPTFAPAWEGSGVQTLPLRVG